MFILSSTLLFILITFIISNHPLIIGFLLIKLDGVQVSCLQEGHPMQTTEKTMSVNLNNSRKQ